LPAPYGLADNGSIVYSADGAIRIADADGTDPRVLIEGPAEDVAPILSNDGTRLLFFRANGGDWDLWAARIDGSEVLALTPAPLSDPRWADWSPDGSRVLVDHVRAGRRIMSVVATDGSRSVRDLDVGLLSAERPMWRPPDGREVVFRGEQDGRAALYSIGADGVGLRQIAPKDAVDDGAYLEPRVAPDGTRMTYWHNRPVDPTPFGETRKSEVHVLDIATGEDVRVGYDPTSRHEFWPKFSPDGRSILMARLEGRDAASVVVALSDGSDGPGRRIARYSGWLATGALSDPVLEFSPDGRKIALSFGAAFRVKIIDVATGTEEFGDNADWVLWQRIAAVGAAATGPGPTPCPGICSR
jgi:Tol biopolymer transport system component